jgi:conjugative relaxase-like TrwC/TraI family protein
MLNISKALNSGQAQSYHQLEFTSETQNYYKQGETVKGEWQGKLAASLGLKGDVAPLEFSRLAEGIHPQTEEPMVRHRMAQEYKNADGTTTKAVEHRAGWDATFSAPKSVSLTALVGGDDRVRKAHRAAVTTALDELERYTQARIGGNNPAETTGKFIAAKFEHDTARPVDGYAAPQLHTHAVIFNVTERADGSTRALQERAFFESQQYATAVYQSALTYQLRSLGYEIESGRSGAPEIKGYSQGYLDASSPRSRQIKEQLEKTGYSGPEAAQIAAHSTRDRKRSLSAEEVLAAHKEMAAAFGNQPEQVVAAARNRALQQDKEPEQKNVAKEAVTFARDSIFEREAVADERAILRDALRRGMGETSYRDIRQEFDRRRNAGEFRSVQGMKHDSARSFTTPETIAAERANIRYVLEGRNAVEPIMSAELAREQANTRSFLNDSQRRVIQEVLTSSDRIHGLQGLAGTGKTTTLQSIREGAEASGYIVEGFAPTSKAAGQLREAGIEATTLQSFLARGQNHPSADTTNRHLYMLDESSLASTRQMRSFLGKLNPGDRVLVIGDTRQHQGVDAGRPFQQMQEAGMQTAQLDQIMRQKDPELLKAVQHLANNETVKGIAMLAKQGRVTEIPNGHDRIAAIARDYAANPENTIIVSPDNRSRQQINEAVRTELRKGGGLSEDGQTLRTLTHRSDMTGADRTWAARYNAGDVLQYSTGSKSEGIERGSFATVQSVNARANTVTVSLESGSTVTYDPRRLKGVNVFREVEREFAAADRVQFTAPNKDLGVANRDLGTVVSLEDGQMSLRMDGKAGRVVKIDTTKFRQFDHGYAVTSHSSQGLTAGRVLAHIDTESSRRLIDNRLAYVSISRASEDARIFTNNAETLGEKLSIDRTKTAAVEHQSDNAKSVLTRALHRDGIQPDNPRVEIGLPGIGL